MLRPMRRLALSAVSLSVVAFTSVAAQAEPNVGRADENTLEEGASGSQAQAKGHFEQALSYYRAGKYRSAVIELQAAIDRDPSGKDLVYNLALVDEKLGDYTAAIAALRRFQALETDAIEVTRAERTIERLEGARAELADETRSAYFAGTLCAKPARGRFDAWVVGATSVAVVAAVTGAIFGVRALFLDPAGSTTGPSTSFDSLRSRAHRAHSSAVIADLAFAVSFASGATAAGLYFMRPPRSAANSFVPQASASSGAWLSVGF
jgi:tetratricopeptide (TPR) repeat protein